MELGAFSVSLAVSNIEKSKQFYQALGFDVIGGVQEQNWLIMRNGDHTIGLFQGMFEQNIMTFNPGWDKQCNTLKSFEDIRNIAKSLEDKGIKMEHKSLDNESGPGSFSIKDPDGNAIMFDQHV